MRNFEEILSKTRDSRDLIIGQNVLNRTPEMFRRLFPGKTAIVVTDADIWKAAGEDVEKSLETAGIPVEEPYIIDDPDLYAEWSFIEQLENHLRDKDVIAVAVGSGVINDLCKLVSGHLRREYMCVGSAASMDGFTSYGASITKDGNKQTFDCPAPAGVVVDSVVMARAPKELVASGYADLIAKIPAGADWMLADAVGSEKVDPFAWSLVQDGLKESLANPAAIHEGDVEMTEKLAEGLIMSGFAMQAIMSSRPASGTEHQFSHCWDMEALSYPDGKHVSHGFKVGIGTLVSTKILELILEQDIENLDAEKCVAQWPSWEQMEGRIRRLCDGKPGHLARCLKETRDKYEDAEGLRIQLERLKAAWPILKEKIREQIIPFEEVYEDLKLVGAPFEPEMICVSRERLRDTLEMIPFMRSRFSGIDVIYRLGLMDTLRERLFGQGGVWEVNDNYGKNK